MIKDSWAKDARTRQVMKGNVSKDTKPELALRRALHALGLRYRVAESPIISVRRSADIVFRRARVAVFVDGCYWHGCPEHYVAAKTHLDYWATKIEANRARDSATTTLLTDAGWTVLRFWAHVDPTEAAKNVYSAIRPEPVP